MSSTNATAPRGARNEASGAQADDLQAARAFFGRDLFASEQCGCVIEEAWPGRSVCSFAPKDHHRNAMGAVMGGAIFTLADFALAVASNWRQDPAVSVSNTIEFVGACKGSRLVATCEADKSGRRLGFYTVRVQDDLGNPVAIMTATCMRV